MSSKAHEFLRRKLSLRANAVRKLFTLLLLTSAPSGSYAQFSYTTSDGAITITKYSGPGGEVTIPPVIDGLPVTYIGDSAFWQCQDLTSIAIPESVISIGDNAFWGSGLTNVYIPASVRDIGFQAFCNCGSLSAITVDALNPTYSSLDGVLFDKSHTLLIQCPMNKEGDYAIPSGVTSVGCEAFWTCVSLTNITIPASVTSLAGRAFYMCANAIITGGNNVTSIGWQAFARTGLRSFTLPDGITSLPDEVFENCFYLNDISFGRNVRNIGSLAFWGCANLAAVVIPDTVGRIGDRAFWGCESLSRVSIGSGVASIEEGAFSESGLTSVVIPDNVTGIADFAFANCLSLTNVTIGNGIAKIGWNAFAECSSLGNVTLGSGITSMETGAFQYCANLRAIYFRGNAPSVDSHEFDGTENVVIYYMPGTTGWGATFGGRPTAFWALPTPQVLNASPSFGVRTNGFGFLISWATNASVIVETCSDLSRHDWWPVSTNLIKVGSGAAYFSDPDWVKYPGRVYRLRAK